MKRIFTFLLAAVIFLTLALPVYADVNADGGGGGMGDGSGSSFWNVGDDGLRVSVVHNFTHRVIKTIDFSNRAQNDIGVHFNYKTKLGYRISSVLNTSISKSYKSFQAEIPLPQIISPAGASNVAEIKQYFSDETALKTFAPFFGIPYDTLIGGEYLLLLEPIAYFTYCSVKFAMTATEAALFDLKKDGKLKYAMQALTHQNLPLSLFLERSALGFDAWGGAKGGIMANRDIISYLGIATVVFDDDTEGDDVGGGIEDKDYVFRTDTDVIISAWVRAGAEDITPDEKARVTFNVAGQQLAAAYVLPKGEKQLVWVRWHTPSAPQQFDITASATHGNLEQGVISVAVVELTEKTPPNPRGTDRNDRFSPLGHARFFGEESGVSWDEWWATWKANWVWSEKWETEHKEIYIRDLWRDPDVQSQTSIVPVLGWTFEPGHMESQDVMVDKGEWEDKGEWIFKYHRYSASLNVSTELIPDAHCPTEYKISTGDWCIKSGYGWQTQLDARVSTNLSAAVTTAQNSVAVFPEFEYEKYFRILTSSTDEFNKSYTFKPNVYSQWESPTHFTPIWYPDDYYEISYVTFDAWTPAGQLYTSSSARGYIQGDVYDDWHIGPYWEE